MATGKKTWWYSTIDNQLYWATRMDETEYRYAAEEPGCDQEP